VVAYSIYIARQPVTLTATPSAGQNFYQYIDSPYWVEGGLSVNPKSFLAPDTGDPNNMTTYYTPTSTPVYTFDSNPDGAQFYVILDGSYWPAPVSFSPFYNSAWSSGSNHTITVPSPEYPWTFNTRYLFSTWSDGGALSHSITLPTTSRGQLKVCGVVTVVPSTVTCNPAGLVEIVTSVGAAP
jgi:hypothetical protein